MFLFEFLICLDLWLLMNLNELYFSQTNWYFFVLRYFSPRCHTYWRPLCAIHFISTLFLHIVEKPITNISSQHEMQPSAKLLYKYLHFVSCQRHRQRNLHRGLRNKKNRMRKHLKTADSFVFVLACFLFALLTHCFEKHFMQMPTKNTFSGPTRNRVQKIMEKY